ALAAYYAEPGHELLWVRADGFTARARHAMAEIRRAEDWGLNVSAFDLPNLAATESRPAALAAAEIKLALAALQYARHARGRPPPTPPPPCPRRPRRALARQPQL